MYLLLINRSVGLIGPTESNPHFINGYSSKVVTNLNKLYITKPLALWHASQDF